MILEPMKGLLKWLIPVGALAGVLALDPATRRAVCLVAQPPLGVVQPVDLPHRP